MCNGVDMSDFGVVRGGGAKRLGKPTNGDPFLGQVGPERTGSILGYAIELAESGKSIEAIDVLSNIYTELNIEQRMQREEILESYKKFIMGRVEELAEQGGVDGVKETKKSYREKLEKIGYGGSFDGEMEFELSEKIARLRQKEMSRTGGGSTEDRFGDTDRRASLNSIEKMDLVGAFEQTIANVERLKDRGDVEAALKSLEEARKIAEDFKDEYSFHEKANEICKAGIEDALDWSREYVGVWKIEKAIDFLKLAEGYAECCIPENIDYDFKKLRCEIYRDGIKKVEAKIHLNLAKGNIDQAAEEFQNLLKYQGELQGLGGFLDESTSQGNRIFKITIIKTKIDKDLSLVEDTLKQLGETFKNTSFDKGGRDVVASEAQESPDGVREMIGKIEELISVAKEDRIPLPSRVYEQLEGVKKQLVNMGV